MRSNAWPAGSHGPTSPRSPAFSRSGAPFGSWARGLSGARRIRRAVGARSRPGRGVEVNDGSEQAHAEVTGDPSGRPGVGPEPEPPTDRAGARAVRAGIGPGGSRLPAPPEVGPVPP